MRIDFNLGVLFQLFCLAQGLSAALYLLLARPRRPGAGWLGGLVLGLTLQVLDYFLSWSGIYAQHKALYFAPLFYSLAFGPLLLNYLRARYAAGPPLARGHWLPGLGQALFFAVLTVQPFATKAWFWLAVHKPVTRFVEYYAAVASLLYYLARARRELAGTVAPVWVGRALRGLQVFYLVAALDPVLNPLYLPPRAPRFYLLSLGLPLLAYGLALLGWLGSRAGVPAAAALAEALPPPAPPHPPPPPDPALLARLVQALETDHLYRDPGLTLPRLAEHLGLTPNAVSALVNGGLGRSFSDWVNGYRLAEVERRLLGPDARRFTLLALALEAGFNSKTTFNRVFKDKHGVAPTAWARTAENKSQSAFRDDAGKASG